MKNIQKHKWGKLCEKAKTVLHRLCRREFSYQEDAQRAMAEYSEKHHFVNCEVLGAHREVKYKKKGRPTKDTPFSVSYSVREEFEVVRVPLNSGVRVSTSLF